MREISREICGVDYDKITLEKLWRHGFNEIIYGDVETLPEVGINKTYEVIVCGDLIEHLNNPGLMLEGVKEFMNNDSEIIITTPNSFGLLSFLRYSLNIFNEGNDHVISFSIFTLKNLLDRYGFRVSEIYTCYNRPPDKITDKIKYSIGIPFFKAIPKYGGTLLITAKLK